MGNTRGWFDRQWVIALLYDEQRTVSDRLDQIPRLQIQSLGVLSERVRESTLKRPMALFSSLQLPTGFYLVKDFLADKKPASPIGTTHRIQQLGSANILE